jgi:hypothetical protein
MAFLTDTAQHLIGRISDPLLFGIIQNLAFCLQFEEEFFLPTPELQAAWFEREIDMLHPNDKLDLIKALCDQLHKNRLKAKSK